jgi:hypothetical protein
LADLLQLEAREYVSPLAPKTPHHVPKADRLIFLHMRGGPSHLDTFDFKPELTARTGQTAKSSQRLLSGSPWKFHPRGQSGLMVSDLLPRVAEVADELCVLKGMHTDIADHAPAILQLHTGSFSATRPSLGSWLLYGLGTVNQNLPGFVSIAPPLADGGANHFGAAFLPAVYQGTPYGDIRSPIRDAVIGNLRQTRLGPQEQRRQIDLVQGMNESFASRDPGDTRIEGLIESMELAFRMQTELPEVMDLAKESAETFALYGIGNGRPSDNFGRQCLLARRLIEAGVRHVEVCDQFWDQHNQLKNGHLARAQATDQPTAGLITDLRQRGLLDRTLVLWGGEFGRTPDTTLKNLDGRDHNGKGYSMWLAGGGVRGGTQYGATDELGYEAVEGKIHLHDLHATVLHAMGLDHERLTYRYAGRDFRLTDVHGRAVEELFR